MGKFKSLFEGDILQLGADTDNLYYILHYTFIFPDTQKTVLSASGLTSKTSKQPLNPQSKYIYIDIYIYIYRYRYRRREK